MPRLVRVLPIGPVNYPTASAFLAGGVPEVMLHLRKLGLLHEDVLTVTGETLGANLDWWEKSERRKKCRERLVEIDGVNPDEDVIEIIVDTNKLEGSINFIGTENNKLSYEEAAKVLEAREPNPRLRPDEDLPDDTRLWAALQSISGGTWGGCVYDVDKIIEVIEAGKKALY